MWQRRLRRVACHVRPQPIATVEPQAPPSETGPLAGIKVVETCQVVAGPLIAAQLAEFGADVIKIENADGKGDGFRMTGTFVEVETDHGTETVASNWHNVNRGKKSLTLVRPIH